MTPFSSIDWGDQASKISQYFTVKEALWLPRDNRMATPTEYLICTAGIWSHAQRMDMVRDFFRKPIVVHCWYRSPGYNLATPGAAKHSAHLEGIATDFHVDGLSVSDAIASILGMGMLEKWDLRMERNTTTWIHLDSRQPGIGGRFFLP